MSINWESKTWGRVGFNVHEDSTGSWLYDNDNDGD